MWSMSIYGISPSHYCECSTIFFRRHWWVFSLEMTDNCVFVVVYFCVSCWLLLDVELVQLSVCDTLSKQSQSTFHFVPAVENRTLPSPMHYVLIWISYSTLNYDSISDNIVNPQLFRKSISIDIFMDETRRTRTSTITKITRHQPRVIFRVIIRPYLTLNNLLIVHEKKTINNKLLINFMSVYKWKKFI